VPDVAVKGITGVTAEDVQRAKKEGLVYESTLRSLFEYVNGLWRRIE
jgi:hypothetical protein